MRLALVIAGPYPALRGSQVLVSHLETGLRQRGHAVVVVSYGPRRVERPGPRPARIAYDAALVARLWRAVRRERVELLHAHNYEAAIAALLVGRFARIPVVYHGHSAHAQELPRYASSPTARRWLQRLGQWLDRQVPRRADAVIAVTSELGVHLRAAGLPADRLDVIEPAVPPAELEAEAAAHGEDGLVCYAGNLDAYQDVAQLLEAFARVRVAEPGARLRLVIHPDAHANAARLAARGLGHGVEFVLARSYAEARAELARAAVVVSPRTEGSGFPMKVLTYMALGKAIVASAGSAKGLAGDVTARIVPDGCPDGFATAVVALLRDATARETLGRAARRRVADGTAWQTSLERVETLHARLVRPPAARTGRAGGPPLRRVAVTSTE